jgi:hypothetical protein
MAASGDSRSLRHVGLGLLMGCPGDSRHLTRGARHKPNGNNATIQPGIRTPLFEC